MSWDKELIHSAIHGRSTKERIIWAQRTKWTAQKLSEYSKTFKN